MASNDKMRWILRLMGRQKTSPPQAAGLQPSGVSHVMITILFLAANPADTVRLKLDEESRQIDLALREGQYRDQFTLEKHYAVRTTDLPALLMRYQPDIVHVSGHGSSDGQILLADTDGRAHPVAPATLARLFDLLRDRVRCVVLNACFSEPQAQAISGSIDCVIGLSDEISDQAALRFSIAFYQALAYGRDVGTAFELGRLQIELAGSDEAAVPRLLTRESTSIQLTLAGQPAAPGDKKTASFGTFVHGGSVGQVINVEHLEGGLTLGE